MDAAALYRQTRDRIINLVSDNDTSAWSPACPDWTVHDLVSHLAGLAEDVCQANVAGYGSDAWTDAQVTARKGSPTKRVIDDWLELDDRLGALMSDPSAIGLPDYWGVVVLTDIVTHEQDIRGALQLPGARNSEAMQVALRSLISGLRPRAEAAGLEPLQIIAPGVRDYMVGRGDPVVRLTAGAWELSRGLTGRRTRDQVAELDWDGDPEPYLDVWLGFPFAWRSEPLVE